ncbi:MAG: M23 family metallopeptidase [Chloroflexi bacterium]|nr:M23 family metallopeptidase [Chloroflexota bacterium]
MLSRLFQRWRKLAWWKQGSIVLAGMLGTAGSGIAALVLYSQSLTDSNDYIGQWFDDPAHRADLTTTRREPCPGAPFLLPSNGLIGLLWNDPGLPYNFFRRHSGIDIFGDGAAGSVPVVAAYDGALTRLPDWKATVIIRHDDPLQPGRTIWTYYTHMASRDGKTSYVAETFPPGTNEVWVEQGTLLGYQGEYSGNSLAPVGLHVHFSVVKSEPDGSFKNEARIKNTLDPSPYLGMHVNIKGKPARPIQCP